MGAFEFVLGPAAIVFVLGLVGIVSSYEPITVYLERRSAPALQAADVTGRLDALETRGKCWSGSSRTDDLVE